MVSCVFVGLTQSGYYVQRVTSPQKQRPRPPEDLTQTDLGNRTKRLRAEHGGAVKPSPCDNPPRWALPKAKMSAADFFEAAAGRTLRPHAEQDYIISNTSNTIIMY